jgi:hypothetical protein
MSDKIEEAKKILSKELLNNQIKMAEEFIENAQKQIVSLQNQVQQQLGIAGLARHLLSTFELPEKVEAKTPDLEVK